MDAVEFLKEKERMCKKTDFCVNCPAYRENNGYDVPCDEFMNEYPKEYVSCVEKWSAEHPAKTRQSEFLKMFPNTPLCENGSIAICPLDVDCYAKCSEKQGLGCPDCKKEYWLAEVE